MGSGKFIVLEGLDGSGKSTHVGLLAERLQGGSVNMNAFTTREPSDGEVGRLIRRALSKQVSLLPETMAWLFAADRYEHVVNEVIPTLSTGRHVICDRYYFSNFAYQCEAVSLDTLIVYNKPSMELLRPDITIFLDLPPKLCIERIASDGRDKEIYEELEILKTVRSGFLRAFDRLKEEENIVIIDADKPTNQVADSIYKAVSEIIKEN